MPIDRPIRVLVVDDSPANRRAISGRLSASGEVEVIGWAADGAEALRLVTELAPDVITLDLEMPRMDGFTFLRLVMARRPTPVIVVSSYAQKENVFRALELGAIDFVAKPDAASPAELDEVLDGVLQKVLLFRSGLCSLPPRPSLASPVPGAPLPVRPRPAEQPRLAPRVLVAITASTGGPSALAEIFSRLGTRGSYAVLVAQHMPDRFTRTFAERLSRRSALSVTEASDGDVVSMHTAFVCPGRQCMEVEMSSGGQLRLRVGPPGPGDRYVPSGNRLLESAARVMRTRVVGVVLTGMGDDGAVGAAAVAQAGGTVLAESADTAVIHGMPGAALRAVPGARAVRLDQVAEAIDRLIP